VVINRGATSPSFCSTSSRYSRRFQHIFAHGFLHCLRCRRCGRLFTLYLGVDDCRFHANSLLNWWLSFKSCPMAKLIIRSIIFCTLRTMWTGGWQNGGKLASLRDKVQLWVSVCMIEESSYVAGPHRPRGRHPPAPQAGEAKRRLKRWRWILWMSNSTLMWNVVLMLITLSNFRSM
jgi:hypothetical protein